MNERSIKVNEQLEGFVQKWETELPPQVVPVLQEHCRNLVSMTAALKAAGHTPEDIRSYVHTLISSYESKLLEAIEVERDP